MNRRSLLIWVTIGLAGWSVLQSSPVAVADDESDGPRWLPSNLAAPFCYVPGETTSWPVLTGSLPGGTSIRLTARAAGRVLDEGPALAFEGIRVSINAAGHLTIESSSGAEAVAFDLDVQRPESAGRTVSQTLEVRPAPPPRPISYVADLVDDIIYIFWDKDAGRFRPIEKSGFDQYFRRLQAQGVRRLVVWQSPFPYLSDPREFSAEDWQRYAGQARAIVDAEELTKAMQASGELESWEWLRELLALRLRPEFGRMFTESAAQHGIALTASFRPFEHALAKYYEVPVFDADGSSLRGFSPLASPAVNDHAEDVGFAHYREVLAQCGRREAAELHAIELSGVKNAAQLAERFQAGQKDLQLIASRFAPIDSSSWVLVREGDGAFRLRRFREIRETVTRRRQELSGFTLSAVDATTLRIEGLRIPDDCPVVLLHAASDFARSLAFPADPAPRLWARAGNRMGRANVYWALDESEPGGRETRIGGILEDGGYRASFQATENSIAQLVERGRKSLALKRNQLVLQLGRSWSTELVDFNRPAARAYAVAQLRTQLSYSAYDEILINTRTHTDLAASSADGADGIGTVLQYRSAGHRRAGYRSGADSYLLLGLDRTYAPRSVAQAESIRDLAQDPERVEQLTTWQRGEWQASCQSSDSPFRWRYERNVAVAQGVRRLLVDLEREFPDVRIRTVLPQRATVDAAVERGLAVLKKSGGGVYGADSYRHIWSTNNYTLSVCEGMTLLDLSGLRVEPVFLGIRYAPDPGPLKLFVDHCILDLADNRGSSFRGPRTFFYEAQETLRGSDSPRATKRREEIIRELLARTEDIGEVLLYEAADWTYSLGLSDPYHFLEP